MENILFPIAQSLRTFWYGPEHGAEVSRSNNIENSSENSTAALTNQTLEQVTLLPANKELKSSKNITSLVVLSPIEQEFSVKKSSKLLESEEKKGDVQPNPKKNFLQKVKNVFKRNEKTSKQTKNTSVTPPTAKKGPVGFVKRSFRRYVLNLLDRSPTNWARALSTQDTSNRGLDSTMLLVSDRQMLASGLSSVPELGYSPRSLPSKIGSFFLNTASKVVTAPVKLFVVSAKYDSRDREYRIFENPSRGRQTQQLQIKKRLENDVWLPSNPPPTYITSPTRKGLSLGQIFQSIGFIKGKKSSASESMKGEFEENIQLPAKMINFQNDLRALPNPFNRSNGGNRNQSDEKERGPEVTANSLKNLALAGKEIAASAGNVVGNQLKSASTLLPHVTIVWPWERSQNQFSDEENDLEDATHYSAPHSDYDDDPPLVEEPETPEIPEISFQDSSSTPRELIPTTYTKPQRSVTRRILGYLLPITSTVLSFLENDESDLDDSVADQGESNLNEEDNGGMITDENNLPPEIRFDMVHPEKDYLANISQYDENLIKRDSASALLGAIPIIGKRITAARTQKDQMSSVPTVPAQLTSSQVKNSNNTPSLPSTSSDQKIRSIPNLELPNINPSQIIEKDGLLQVPSSFLFSTISKTAEMASKLKPPSLDGLPSLPLPPPSSLSPFEELSSMPLTTVQSASGVPMVTIDETAADGVKFGRTQDMVQKPRSLPNIPIASTADFNFLFFRQINNAITAALQIKTEQDGLEFMKTIGIQSLIDGILCKEKYDDKYDRVDAVKGLCRLSRSYRSVADQVGRNKEVVNVLCEMMEAPLKGFIRSPFRNSQDKEKELRALHEAVAFVQRLVRTSDIAVEELRQNNRLRKVLTNIIQAEAQLLAALPQSSSNGNSATNMVGPTLTNALAITNQANFALKHGKANGTTVLIEPIQLSFEDTKASKTYVMKKRDSTTIVEYVNLKPHQMARVALWGLGGVPWKPKQPGQRGVRILSFDGGGTRGVLSIAYLKEIFKRLQKDNLQPHQVFDIICGTSTGGIIAMLFGAQRNTIDESEQLYDDFIGKIFASKSNLKLVTEKALYDEKEFERILYQMCGDQLLLDSNQNECSRVFCISTKVNANPPQTQIWRNYNYPIGVRNRNPGAFRINTLTAVRATTAAPTFFTPVPWEGGLYCDGALVANNPTAIAIEEAKVINLSLPLP